MSKAKKILWTIYFLFFCRPYSLKQFKIYCLKIDGMSQSEWDEFETGVMNSPTLRKYFRIKTITTEPVKK
jgi:hypothetical protein